MRSTHYRHILWFGLLILFIAVWGMGQVPVPANRLSPAPTTTRSPAPITPPANKLGIHLLLDDGRNHWPIERWPEHLTYARQAVGEWGFVVQLVRLDDLDPVKWQPFMDECARLHLTPVLRLATTYDRQQGYWIAPPLDDDGTYQTVAARYATFITALQWPTEEHWIIVGNEPNHGNEWGGKPDPAAYARFLIDVADTLHTVDPGARILNAGFDPYAPHTGDVPLADGSMLLDEETFLDRMVDAYPDVFRRLDVWASHSYPSGPFRDAPWEQTFQIDYLNGARNSDHDVPPTGIYNQGVNAYEWELFKLAEFGVPALPVLITETGWRHAEAVNSASTDGGEDLPDVETAAVYLDLALHGNQGRYAEYPETGWTPWLDDPRVIGVVFFALNGDPVEWGHTNWLQMDATGRVIGVYPLIDHMAYFDGQ